MIYVQTAFFLAMLAMSIFGPPIAFALGRWSKE